MGKNQHVVPAGDKWAVRGEGNTRNTRVFDTQKEAIETATEMAKNQRSELIVHDKKGDISRRNSYGNDPNPPKG